MKQRAARSPALLFLAPVLGVTILLAQKRSRASGDGALTPQDLYREAYADWRMYDSYIWQTATLAITAGGAIILFGYFNFTSHGARSLLLAVGFFVGFALQVGLTKHRYFSRTRSEALESLEKEAREHGTTSIEIQRHTLKRQKNQSRYDLRYAGARYATRFEEPSAYRVLARTLAAALLLSLAGISANTSCLLGLDAGFCKQDHSGVILNQQSDDVEEAPDDLKEDVLDD